MFAEAGGAPAVTDLEQLPIVTIVTAFVTSELRTAFQMGFAVFLPFVIVDVIVASVLMSLGMFMLPPAMISLPFKLLLFVLADGWSLVFQNLDREFPLMSNALALDLMRSAIQIALVVAAPMLIAALLVGLIVGLLQAVTQIQEQTLTFIPKLLVMTLVFVTLLPWFVSRLVEYLAGVLRTLPTLTA